MRGEVNGLALKELARAMAVVAHEGQCRKGTGEPYFNHVERVADAQQGWEAKTVAYLHDLVEDTEISLVVLRMLFPSKIVRAVDYLTRRVIFQKQPAFPESLSETYKDFIERLAVAVETNEDHAHQSQLLALDVKLADIRDNLRDINDVPGGGASLERRYTWALERLLGTIEERGTW